MSPKRRGKKKETLHPETKEAEAPVNQDCKVNTLDKHTL